MFSFLAATAAPHNAFPMPSAENSGIVPLLYLVAGVFFILALRGLSSPATSRTGNRFGMAGMGIALATTLITHDIANIAEIGVAILLGGIVGFTIARRIAMTAMPQLVAAFHSLVGMAAVLVAVAAFMNPEAFGILDPWGNILSVSRVEMALGAAIGAVTFSGSVIAFAKLNGNMSGAPIMLPARHVINLGTLLAIIAGTALYAMAPQAGPGEGWVFWAIVAAAFAIGFLLIIPIGGADMPVVISMLNSYSGWAAAAMGFTLHNTAMIITGALVGSSGAILSYIMCRAMNRSFISVIAGGFGVDASAGGAGGGTASLQERKRRRRGLHARTGGKGHNHSRLWHGGGAGAARAARNGRQAEREGCRGQIRDSSGGGADARAHERTAGRSQRAL